MDEYLKNIIILGQSLKLKELISVNKHLKLNTTIPIIF